MARVNNLVQYRYQLHAPAELDDATYKLVTPSWVKACIDACLYYQHHDGSWRIVIGKRRNKPLQNQWWVPGGRILNSDMSLQDAIIRKVNSELGIKLTKQQVPNHVAALNYFHWEEDKSVVLAAMMHIQLTTEQASAAPPTNSPEFTQVQHVDPRLIAKAPSPYNEYLRDVARALIEAGCIG